MGGGGLVTKSRSCYVAAIPDEPESLPIRLLQEIRADIGELRAEVKGLTRRVDGNTLILNLVASVVQDHEQRIGRLEHAR